MIKLPSVSVNGQFIANNVRDKKDKIPPSSQQTEQRLQKDVLDSNSDLLSCSERVCAEFSFKVVKVLISAKLEN